MTFWTLHSDTGQKCQPLPAWPISAWDRWNFARKIPPVSACVRACVRACVTRRTRARTHARPGEREKVSASPCSCIINHVPPDFFCTLQVHHFGHSPQAPGSARAHSGDVISTKLCTRRITHASLLWGSFSFSPIENPYEGP